MRISRDDGSVIPNSVDPIRIGEWPSELNIGDYITYVGAAGVVGAPNQCWTKSAIEQAVIRVCGGIAASNIFSYEVSGTKSHLNRIFDWSATTQALRKSIVEILKVSKAGNSAPLVSPIKNFVGRLFPNLISAGQSERHKMAAKRLMRILGIGRVPVPLCIPMN